MWPKRHDCSMQLINDVFILARLRCKWSSQRSTVAFQETGHRSANSGLTLIAPGDQVGLHLLFWYEY